MLFHRSRFMKWTALVLVALFGLNSGLAMAQSYDPQQDIPKPTVWEKRLNKLGRGLSNVLFGWTEIPLTWHRKIEYGRPLTEIVATGSVIGFSRFLIRTGTGVYEMVTFPVSSEERKYEAIIEPAYLF